jgi:hypothetical protein
MGLAGTEYNRELGWPFGASETEEGLRFDVFETLKFGSRAAHAADCGTENYLRMLLRFHCRKQGILSCYVG